MLANTNKAKNLSGLYDAVYLVVENRDNKVSIVDETWYEEDVDGRIVCRVAQGEVQL